MRRLLFSFLIALPSLACQTPCKIPSISQAFDLSSSVFLGVVRGKKVKGSQSELAFQLERIWKGEPASWLDVRSERSTCDPMGDNARVGERYLVFATQASDGLFTGLCSGTYAISSPQALNQVSAVLDPLALLSRKIRVPLDPPPKNADQYQRWVNQIIKKLAICSNDRDCRIVFYDCPWGCGTSVNRNADGDQLLRLVNGYPGSPCEYRCETGPWKPKCINGTCGQVKR